MSGRYGVLGDRSIPCRIDGCSRIAGSQSGLCKRHWENEHKHTSDGRSTGPKPKLTPDQVAEARRMRAAFKSNHEIAQHFGVHTDTVRRHLKLSVGEVGPPASASPAGFRPVDVDPSPRGSAS